MNELMDDSNVIFITYKDRVENKGTIHKSLGKTIDCDDEEQGGWQGSAHENSILDYFDC